MFQDLPNPTPLRMEIPTELFGDAVMILEFLHVFMKLLDSDQFPDGFSIGESNILFVNLKVQLGALCN